MAWFPPVASSAISISGSSISRKIRWLHVRYEFPDGLSDVPIDDPTAAPYIEDIAYVYDPAGGGNPYRAITTTPGFGSQIQPYQGFWIRLESQAALDGANNGGTLILPLTE